MRYNIVKELPTGEPNAWAEGTHATLVWFEDNTYSVVCDIPDFEDLTVDAEAMGIPAREVPRVAVFLSTEDGEMAVDADDPLAALLGPAPLWLGESREEFFAMVTDHEYDASEEVA